jgi:hypothetical protein
MEVGVWHIPEGKQLVLTRVSLAIFEIFQNHHPEYVSLAYGAFKFLFVVSQRPIYTAVDGLSPSAALPCANDTGPRF